MLDYALDLHRSYFPALIMSPNHEITGEPGSDFKFPTRTEGLQTTLSAATQLFAVWFVFKGMDEMFAPVNICSAFFSLKS